MKKLGVSAADVVAAPPRAPITPARRLGSDLPATATTLAWPIP